MFSNAKINDSFTTSGGTTFQVLAVGEYMLFGIEDFNTVAYAINEGYSNNTGYDLIVPFDVNAELQKVEKYNLDAVIAFIKLGQKINAIKFLREVQKAAGRPGGLVDCRNMYETYCINYESSYY